MFSTPPPRNDDRPAEKTVRTRGAFKRQMELFKNEPVHQVHSEIIKAEASGKVQLPNRPFTEGGSLKRSIHSEKLCTAKNSGSNISIEARKKQLEYEAAKAKAAIEKELLDKKLAADLAALGSQSGKSQCSSRHKQSAIMGSAEKVEQWLEKSHNNGVPAPPAAMFSSSPDLHNLVSAIQETNLQNKLMLSRFAASKDLPQFHGDPLEWLAFKQAYEESSTFCGFSGTENTWRLRKCLHGEAKEAVSFLLITNTAPNIIIETLELRFGRPEIIINKITQKLKKLPSLSHNYHHDIVSFAIKIKDFVAAAQAVQQIDYLRSPELVTLVLCKCPNALLNKWADYYSMHNCSEKAKLELIAEFLYSEANKISAAGLSHIYSQADSKKKPEERKPHSVLVNDSTENNEDTPKCKFCLLSNHRLPECARFKRALTRDRWRYIRTHKLCHKCLVASHDRDTCPASPCDVESCELPHHRLLHWKPKNSVQITRDNSEIHLNNDNNVLVNINESSAPSESNETVANTNINASHVFLKVVPIILHGPSGKLLTHALLDDGASVSLIAADVADHVGLKGRKQTLCVRGAWNSELSCESEVIKCKITNQNNQLYELNVRKINELDLPIQKLSKINIKNYEHLNHIDKSSLCCVNVKPKVLIGQDNYQLIAPIKTIIRKRNEPCATLTPLGWCIHGMCSTSTLSSELLVSVVQQHESPASATHRRPRHACTGAARSDASLLSLIAATPTGACEATSDWCARAPERCPRCNDNAIHTALENDIQLHELVRKSFMFESIGINNKPRQNKNELRAVTIVENSARLRNGKWEVGLPWKDENAQMADSYANAYRRLKATERKSSLDKEYAAKYQEKIHHLFVNHYAREVEDDEHANKIWYLPHFGVHNLNKKKLRLVFDAAALSAERSLNDYLLQGPDLLESLLGIMLRFRERAIGLTGDIKEFFLRVKIRPEDQHALRFLWRDNPEEPVKKYAMTSLIFGANCSPFIAQHIKNKNALRFNNEMPDAVAAIIKNHYMDDYIDCFDECDTAVRTMKEVSYIHKQGDFEIRNWTSNEPQVCQDMPRDVLSDTAVKFKTDEDDRSERTLGLLWFPGSDTFGFNLSLDQIPEAILKGRKRPTKRELLRLVMSIFDIYGLIIPFTIKGKIIVQHTWKCQTKWDEQLPSKQFENFRNWITQLHELKEIRVPRWYFHPPSPKSNSDSNIPDSPRTPLNSIQISETLQLHIFCDASPTAYAAVAYWRAHDSADHSDVRVSFIASKARVAPIKTVSIPRLELQAAVLACRLADIIQEEHRCQPIKRYFWTDSTTVLYWIKNENRNYKMFIANRLGEIDELSNISEWRYIPSERNIADIATKNKAYKLHQECEWFRGPTFLYDEESAWPISSYEKEKIDISEEILETINHVTVCDDNDLPIPDPAKFSSWLRLLRCTAAVLLFIEKCKKTCKTTIDAELLLRAEKLIIRFAQRQSFAPEIHQLRINKPISPSSRLRTLTPYIDEDEIIRVDGRIGEASKVTYDSKRPVILDGHHPVARLITKHHHEKMAHGCNETVVNELRQKYWLINLRPTVRTISSRCSYCRIKRASPSIPRMADLPAARLAHHQRAFTHCGVDLFGPMEITVGRRRERRYGVLFTCMTVRAVHLELVPSLTADSFIMAIRRMAARRGWPLYMYSDNGTNLRGAEAELRKSFLEIDQARVNQEITNQGMSWSFISPISPHKGGAWERLIKSVKTALRVILKERAPREEVLLTLLAEVENIINSRPLTHVSVDAKDMEALTPNHFLIGSSSNLPVPGDFNDGDLYLRKMWRIAQRLADMFWQRWVKEFLPTLLPRQKWYQEGKNLQPGDVVIILDPNVPRNTWQKGRVQKVFPGTDGRVRTVEICTKSGILTRPVTRLAPLPMLEECP